jgi:hypothetical protein
LRILDLLGSPPSVGFTHVGGRLDGGDELEDDVSEADHADDSAGNDTENTGTQDYGANKDVD